MKSVFCKKADKPCRTEAESNKKALEKSMRAYKCEFCDFWHLTSKKKRTKSILLNRPLLEEHEY